MPAMKATELKGLQTRRDKLSAEMRELQAQQKHLQRDWNGKQVQLTEITNKIKKIEETSKDIVVTEHAIVRYIERVLGMNLRELHTIIVPPDTEQTINQLGGGTFTTDTHRIVVRGRTVVTVEPLS